MQPHHQKRLLPRCPQLRSRQARMGRAHGRQAREAVLCSYGKQRRRRRLKALHIRIRRQPRACRALPRHLACDAAGAQKSRSKGCMPLCGHTLLPHPLLLLQLRKSVGGKEHEANPALSRCADAGDRRRRGCSK